MRKQSLPSAAQDKSTLQGVFLGLFALILIGVFFFYREVLGFDAIKELRRALFPCKPPIEYTLGSFDERFDITEAQFLEALAEAEKLWEDAAGFELFEYTNGRSDLAVNLVYDYRQAGTEKLEQIGSNIEANNETYESLKNEYDAAYETYLAQKAELDTLLKAHDTRSAAYTEAVEQTKQRGGAKPHEYRQLEAERESLNAEAAMINQKVADINTTADSVNALAEALNDLAERLNISAARYNTIGDVLGDEFVEGTYGASGNEEVINIYQFESQEKLIRVLAHELGHALGLDHVEDPEAVMYRLNDSENGQLTEADVAALKLLCRIE